MGLYSTWVSRGSVFFFCQRRMSIPPKQKGIGTIPHISLLGQILINIVVAIGLDNKTIIDRVKAW